MCGTDSFVHHDIYRRSTCIRVAVSVSVSVSDRYPAGPGRPREIKPTNNNKCIKGTAFHFCQHLRARDDAFSR